MLQLRRPIKKKRVKRKGAKPPSNPPFLTLGFKRDSVPSVLTKQQKEELAKRRNSIEKYKPPPKEPEFPLFL